MNMDYANGYASIVKYDKNDDGTLMVFGKATDDTLDLDSQICDPSWLDTAMPAWFKSGGNIREMHGPSAAGVAKEYESKADGHYIGVHVVDPIAVKKVEARVYQGFSIGIKSPRVVRDTKASNGRIIDGSIVEISLVDRPANPSAKLILAKSVEGESTLVRVEEAHEYKAPLPTQIAKMTTKGSKMETIKQITELAKSLTPNAVKFDQTLFDNARRALAELIAMEAAEMTEGHDERNSLAALVGAVHALMAWYEGEEAESEVPSEIIELAADKEVAKAEDCPDCTEDKMCDKCAELAADMEKSAESHKCLECGCGLPAENHGRNDVTTAEMVLEDGAPKSADADEVPATEEAPAAEAELVAEELPEVSEDKTSEDTALEEAVEKAVKSAMEKLQAEIDAMRAEKESAVEKSVKLETELATALTKTVAGGPKRTATKMSTEAQNDLLVKAATYKAKADASTDPLLSKGYREIANDFIAKASPKSDN